MEYKDFSTHFPEQISGELVRFVTDTVLKMSRYLFFKSVVGEQYAHCTHCNKRHRSTIKLKHKQKERVQCPHCQSLCEVRAAGVSRKYMADKGALVWYERSRVNREGITARIISVYRNYSQGYENVKTEYNCSHMYLFEPGKSVYWDCRSERKSVFSAFDRNFVHFPKFRSDSNIRAAVKGTPFQYSTWEHYTKYANSRYVSDMVEFFDLAARYSCIEYLTKLGFQKMVWAQLYKNSGLGAINWRGKTLEKVLRLTKMDIREVQKSKLDWGPRELKYLQDQRRAGSSMPVEDAFILSEVDNNYYRPEIEKLAKHHPRTEVFQYLLKQVRRDHSSSVTNVLLDFRDYLKQCHELGLDLREERNMYPNDLHAAHQKLTERVRIKKNRFLESSLKKRLPNLKANTIETVGFIIRPFESIEELFQEGKKLKHCVGGYGERFAKGETDLYAVRLGSKPEEPYYTLQVTDKRLIQCRGKGNASMNKAVQQAVEVFMQQLIMKKRAGSKKPKMPQEVAI